jgi:WD40 repeat protein
MWDLETGTCLRALEGHAGRIGLVRLNSDGRRAVSSSEDHTLRVWDLETGACLALAFGHTAWEALSVATDSRLVAGTDDGDVQVFDLHEPKA